VTATKEHFGSASVENVIISGAGVSYHVSDMTITVNDAVVNGAVKNTDGQPIADVDISCERAAKKTDVNGNFSFSGLTAGNHKILVSKGGYESNKFFDVNISDATYSKDIVLYRIDLEMPVDSSPGIDNHIGYAQLFVPSYSILRKIRWNKNIQTVYAQVMPSKVQIATDDGGQPSTTILGETTQISKVSYSTYQPYEAIFNIPISLTPGSKYWMILCPATNGYLVIDYYDAYSAGKLLEWDPNEHVWNQNVGHNILFCTLF
jgi:copper chaperone CopZ